MKPKAKLKYHPLQGRDLICKTIYKLPEKNGHPLITRHSYFYMDNSRTNDKRKNWLSVTGLVGKLFPFDREKISRELAIKFRKKKHKLYHGLSQAEILWLWHETASIGTILHEACEKFIMYGRDYKFHGIDFKRYKSGTMIPEGSKERVYYANTINSMRKEFRDRLWNKEKGKLLEIEFGYFKKYLSWMKSNGFVVYQYDYSNFGFTMRGDAVEIKVTSNDMRVSGMFDILFYNKVTGEFILADLKRARKKIIPLKNLKKVNEDSFLAGCEKVEDVFSDFRDLVENVKQYWKYRDYVKYSIQLSIYNYIMETKYANKSNFKYRCKEMHIVRLFHNEKGPNVIAVKPQIFHKRMRKIEEIVQNEHMLEEEDKMKNFLRDEVGVKEYDLTDKEEFNFKDVDY